MKRFNAWDLIIVLIVIAVGAMFYINLNTRASDDIGSLVRIEGKAGNLEKEIARSVDIGDVVVDKNGKEFFVIDSVLVRPSRQAIPNWENEVIAVDSPELETIEFTAISVNPNITPDNIFYNWQLMNPGMKIYIETNKTGFFAIITRIEEVPDTMDNEQEGGQEEI